MVQHADIDHTGLTGVGGGAAAGEANEEAAGVLVDATSTGDAGSRADHFPGTSLDAAWVAEATALSGGPTVKNSVLAMIGPASAAAHHRLRAFTPSAAFRAEVRVRVLEAVTGRGFGFFIRDSGTGDTSGDGMMLDISPATSNVVAYSLDSGSYVSRGSNAVLNPSSGDFWVYLAIERDGSNAWTLQVSNDRAEWISVVAGHSKTFTVAKAGFRVFNAIRAKVDFFDVVS